MPKIKEMGIAGALGVRKPNVTPLKTGGAFNWGKTKENKEDKWAGPLPPHWSDSSRSKFYSSMSDPNDVGKKKEGPTTNCMKKIDGHVDDPGAFCASLRDRVTGTTHWRHGGGKKK